MQHGLMYQGNYEDNYPALKPGATSYRGTDGAEHRIPDWPKAVNGVRVGYMEKAGKKFFAVRLQFEGHDIILKEPLLLDQSRHLGSHRFSPEPTVIGDELATHILDDISERNPEQRRDITLLVNRINQVRRETREGQAHA